MVGRSWAGPPAGDGGDPTEYEEIAPDELGRIRSLAIPGLWVDPAWLWSDPIQSAPAALRLILAG